MALEMEMMLRMGMSQLSLRGLKSDVIPQSEEDRIGHHLGIGTMAFMIGKNLLHVIAPCLLVTECGWSHK